MTTSFINEATVDQELQLTELAQLNGAMPILIVAGYAGAGAAIGWFGSEALEWFDENREEIADAIHDAISEEDDAKNSGSYREEPGSRGGNRYGKPVLK